MSNIDPQKKNYTVLIVLITIFVALLGGLFYYYKHTEKAINNHKEQALQEDTVMIDPENILGNYFILFVSGDVETRQSGYIDQDSFGQVVLHILSQYDPRTLILDIQSDGKIYNDELGYGSMTYKSSIGKTSIKFENNGLICILTK